MPFTGGFCLCFCRFLRSSRTRLLHLLFRRDLSSDVGDRPYAPSGIVDGSDPLQVSASPCGSIIDFRLRAVLVWDLQDVIGQVEFASNGFTESYLAWMPEPPLLFSTRRVGQSRSGTWGLPCWSPCSRSKRETDFPKACPNSDGLVLPEQALGTHGRSGRAARSTVPDARAAWLARPRARWPDTENSATVSRVF